MITINKNNIYSAYFDLLDSEETLVDVCSELEFPLYLLGNKTRYALATERRNLKHKINKLKESLYERPDNC